jgi:copper transport protein
MVRRALSIAAALLLAGPASAAHAHALLVAGRPSDRASVASAPARVTLRFTEPVGLLRATDAVVVDERGRRVSLGARAHDRVVVLRLRRGLPPSSYTVRYRVDSADSHVVEGDTTFATGGAPLRDPVLGTLGAGPSDRSAYAVVARFLELAGLGAAVALVAFLWLAWADADVAWGRRRFWPGWWSAIAVALAGEAAVLVTKAATSLGTSVPGAATDPDGVYRVLSETRFGEHFQVRVGLLLGLVAVSLWHWLGDASAPRTGGLRRPPTLVMGALAAACLVLISAEGHASQAPLAALSVADDATHLLAVSVWVGGLAALAVVLADGPVAVRPAVVARFSRVALVAVGVAVATGALRALAELGAVRQLWDTAYGRSILIKVALLAAALTLATRTRTRTTPRLVRAELALTLAIVAVASLLVAQVPGRT